MNDLQNIIKNLNPSCWLDSTTINGDGIVQPTVGSTITEWKDISGNGRHFTFFNSVITTGMTAPTLVNTSFYNGTYPSVYFTLTGKTNLTYPLGNGIFGSNNAATFVLVTKYVSDSDLINTTYGTSGNFALSNSFRYKDNYDTNGSSFGNRSFSNGPRLANDVIIFKIKKETSTGLKNGISVGQQAGGTNEYLRKQPIGISSEQSIFLADFSQDKFVLGCFYINTNQTFTSFGTGAIFEIIIFHKILSDEETRQVQSYLKQKYNI